MIMSGAGAGGPFVEGQWPQEFSHGGRDGSGSIPEANEHVQRPERTELVPQNAPKFSHHRELL